MKIGQKVFIEVEVVQIIEDANGIYYRVSLDPKKSFNNLDIKDADIRFQEVR
ncbi:MAG: hypothetical protein RBU23_05075 [Candidatus Auribacterota bacterium]|jgi:hypothetical protein|nr:hypothetical protein [Candidatus Auribacterota bacterium]